MNSRRLYFRKKKAKLAKIPAAPLSGIAFDAAASATGTSVSSLSWSHTCSGSNRLLVVTTAAENSTSANCFVTALTYNGTALTKTAELQETGDGNVVSIWYLVNPPVGTNTVSVTYAGVNAKAAAGSMSFTGVNQTTPIDAASVTTTLGSSPVTLNITTVTVGAWVIDAFASGFNPTLTPGTGQTIRWGGNAVPGAGGTKGPISPAGSTAMSESWSGFVQGAYAIVAIRPASGGGSNPVALGPATISGTSSVSAQIRVARECVASTSSTTAVTAQLRAAKEVKATTSTTTALTTQIRVARECQSSTSSTSTASLTLRAAKECQATTSSTTSVSASLRAAKELQAPTSSTSATVEALRVARELQTNTSSTSSTTATLTVSHSNTVALGTATITSTTAVTAQVRVAKELKATAATTSATTAALRATKPLGGVTIPCTSNVPSIPVKNTRRFGLSTTSNTTAITVQVRAAKECQAQPTTTTTVTVQARVARECRANLSTVSSVTSQLRAAKELQSSTGSTSALIPYMWDRVNQRMVMGQMGITPTLNVSTAEAAPTLNSTGGSVTVTLNASAQAAPTLNVQDTETNPTLTVSTVEVS